ncbi:MAG: HIT family protein [Devosiaceae bacterium]|nr:HIT family protein [Devosiaceae bacterium]
MPTYEDDNIFAKILRNEIPNFTIYEDDDILVMMDVMPMSDGHCLVLPKSPSRNLLDADVVTLQKVLPLVQKIANATKKAMNADGIILQQFNEAPAGQSVFHLHFHIIPAYEGKKLLRHSDKMADSEMLAKQARAIANEL